MVGASKAAELLGANVRRVTELARSGALKAQKLSGVWAIDEDSIKSSGAPWRERLAASGCSFESKQFFASPARQLLLVEDMSWVKLDKLEGFVDAAAQILSQSRDLELRLPYIRAALEWRIKRISDIVEWE